MEIVAIDEDDRADGNGKAGLTWISKTLLLSRHVMNPANSGNAEGTGTIGGWEKSEMRAYLKETIKPLIPAEVRNSIVEVTKYSIIYTTDAQKTEAASTEDVWIPSIREMSGTGSGFERNGATYSAVFPIRIKKSLNGIARKYWLRSASSTSNFRTVETTGNTSNSTANYTSGYIALGFCTN